MCSKKDPVQLKIKQIRFFFKKPFLKKKKKPFFQVLMPENREKEKRSLAHQESTF